MRKHIYALRLATGNAIGEMRQRQKANEEIERLIFHLEYRHINFNSSQRKTSRDSVGVKERRIMLIYKNAMEKILFTLRVRLF